MTIRMRENKTKIESFLTKKEDRRFLLNEKAIPGEYQHAQVVADIDNKKIRNVMRKTRTERRNISLAERSEKNLKKM